MDREKKAVLACIDGSASDGAVCDYAAWISRKLDLPLQLFHNIARPIISATDLSGTIGLGSQEQLMQELLSVEEVRARLSLKQGKLMLEAARDRVINTGGPEPSLLHRHGSLAESLLEIEQEIRVLVLGIGEGNLSSDGRHLNATLETTIRALQCPILVVNSDFTEPRKVMLAYDGSQASDKALDMLSQSPLFKGTPVHLVTVGQDQDAVDKLQVQASAKLTRAGHQVTAFASQGHPSGVLCQYQSENHIDMTLMGAFSHSRLREVLLGSTTAKMLLGADKPLWLLR